MCGPTMQRMTDHAEDPIVSRRVQITNRLGLHARPAMQFVETANRFQARVLVAKGTDQVDGKSIMQVMVLAAACGTTLTLTADGPDAAQAIEALCALVKRKFDED